MLKKEPQMWTSVTKIRCRLAGPIVPSWFRIHSDGAFQSFVDCTILCSLLWLGQGHKGQTFNYKYLKFMTRSYRLKITTKRVINGRKKENPIKKGKKNLEKHVNRLFWRKQEHRSRMGPVFFFAGTFKNRLKWYNRSITKIGETLWAFTIIKKSEPAAKILGWPSHF